MHSYLRLPQVWRRQDCAKRNRARTCRGPNWVKYWRSDASSVTQGSPSTTSLRSSTTPPPSPPLVLSKLSRAATSCAAQQIIHASTVTVPDTAPRTSPHTQERRQCLHCDDQKPLLAIARSQLWGGAGSTGAAGSREVFLAPALHALGTRSTPGAAGYEARCAPLCRTALLARWQLQSSSRPAGSPRLWRRLLAGYAAQIY